MTLTATEFKARCLQILDIVCQTGEKVKITKRGKVVAVLGPDTIAPETPVKAGFGKGEFEIVGDIIEPLDVEWEALK